MTSKEGKRFSYRKSASPNGSGFVPKIKIASTSSTSLNNLTVNTQNINRRSVSCGSPHSSPNLSGLSDSSKPYLNSPTGLSKRFTTQKRVVSTGDDISKRRSALREFYKLDDITKDPSSQPDTNPKKSSKDEEFYEKKDFDEVKYVQELLETKKMQDILKEENKLYRGKIQFASFSFINLIFNIKLFIFYLEVRTLDSEQKALVYNNYYKLISAAESLHSVSICHNHNHNHNHRS